ncbi:hypothetical protein FOL47_000523 [Perkinsus chesapeaki]|uniref:Uncharacterized protein n=1 Tax=Perkinsus chesapeaki TaxID=330153 RepID=A0A7J6KXG4_PERCH|nr:hypothetical protein FOL47_000523 [Perkinsus chesapeaki]
MSANDNNDAAIVANAAINALNGNIPLPPQVVLIDQRGDNQQQQQQAGDPQQQQPQPVGDELPIEDPQPVANPPDGGQEDEPVIDPTKLGPLLFKLAEASTREQKSKKVPSLKRMLNAAPQLRNMGPPLHPPTELLSTIYSKGTSATDRLQRVFAMDLSKFHVNSEIEINNIHLNEVVMCILRWFVTVIFVAYSPVKNNPTGNDTDSDNDDEENDLTSALTIGGLIQHLHYCMQCCSFKGHSSRACGPLGAVFYHTYQTTKVSDLLRQGRGKAAFSKLLKFSETAACLAVTRCQEEAEKAKKWEEGKWSYQKRGWYPSGDGGSSGSGNNNSNNDKESKDKKNSSEGKRYRYS